MMEPVSIRRPRTQPVTDLHQPRANLCSQAHQRGTERSVRQPKRNERCAVDPGRLEATGSIHVLQLCRHLLLLSPNITSRAHLKIGICYRKSTAQGLTQAFVPVGKYDPGKEMASIAVSLVGTEIIQVPEGNGIQTFSLRNVWFWYRSTS